MYENSPRHLVNQFGVSWKNNGEELVWGGEAAMWSEQVLLPFCHVHTLQYLHAK